MPLGMRVRVLVGLLLLTTLTTCATPASAHKRFARALGERCKTCHVAVEGGGPRTLLGQYYQATETLPADRSPQTMKLVESTVDRWLLEQLSVPPVIRWRHTPIAQLPTSPPTTLTPLPDHDLLRRVSLDLRGIAPTTKEQEALSAGKSIDAFVDEFMASEAFSTTFFRYHMDIMRPREGIFGPKISFSKLVDLRGPLRQAVYSSERFADERAAGACKGDKVVEVSPWWDRSTTVKVCARTAAVDVEVEVKGKKMGCDTEAGQESGRCGCGPHLVHCWIDAARRPVIDAMNEEMARLAMTVVQEDLPYSEVLTADWSMLDGNLEVAYGRVWGKQRHLDDADAKKSWRKVDRGVQHSGVLSSPAMFNFYYNGRRWAQRTLEAFFCHETTPDFDLLDDTADAGGTIAIWYRDSPDLMPTANVTEGRACAACHLQLDAVARVRDRWDFYGRFFDVMPGKRPLPIPQQAVFDGEVVDGLDGFGKALARSETFHDCVVTQAWTHLLGHRFTSSETAVRQQLLQQFERDGLKFKALLKAIIKTPEYRAKESTKLMKREQYAQAMRASTDVDWRVGGFAGIATENGFDVHYDKVGGMDYRKIEFRDIRPGIGHSLVQFKAAAETCDALVDHERRKDPPQRLWLTMIDDVRAMPTPAQIDDAISALTRVAVARPAAAIAPERRAVLRSLYDSVAGKSGSIAGYTAVCTAVYGSADYALY
jgi:hypothetical protein